MKCIVVTTVKGNTESVVEYNSKKSAEAELDSFGWRRTSTSIPTWFGTIRNQFGMPQDCIATLFSLKEWESAMKYCY